MVNNASDIPKPLDIVLLTPTLDGGVGRVVSLLVQGMHEHNLSAMVWTLGDGAYENETRKWAEIKNLDSVRARGLIRPLVTLLRTHKPRVILSASFHINCIAVIARVLSRVPTQLFIAEHTSLDTGLATLTIFKRLLAKICIRLCYPHADGWIAVSQGVAQHMAAYSHIKQKCISVIYNPVVTTEMINMSKEPIEHPFFKLNEPVILAVGRLSVEKDYPTLLKAFHDVSATIPTRLIIIGDGPERKSIEEYIQKLGITERVSLLGTVSNPYPYFTRSNLYVLSSTREGLPTTLIEALALGTPIVSTDIPSGPREILNGGEYGKLVPAKDSVTLANAIITTLQSERPQIPANATFPYQFKNAVDNYLHILFPEKF